MLNLLDPPYPIIANYKATIAGPGDPLGPVFTLTKPGTGETPSEYDVELFYKPETGIRTAVVYRTQAKALKTDIEAHNYGESDQVQFEICEFSDGRVAQRWRIGSGSSVWWDKLEDLYSVHIYAHPDYGTRVEWSDGTVEEL